MSSFRMGCLDSLLSPIVLSDLEPIKINDLKSKGIKTLGDFLLTEPDELSYKFNIPSHDHVTAKEDIQQHLAPVPITAAALYLTPSYLSTGIQKLDCLLGGRGLKKSELVEIYGKSSCGKSQLAHKILSSVLYSNELITGVYFDTKNDFSPMRLIEFAGGDEENLNFLRKVRVVKEGNLDKILQVLDYLKKEYTKNEAPFIKQCKLLIFDSFPTIFYPDLSSGRGDPNQNPNDDEDEDGQFKIETFILKLRELMSTYGLFVVGINHAVSLFQRNSRMGPKKLIDGIKPALGLNWKRVPHTRLKITSSAKYESISRIRISTEKSATCQINKFCYLEITKTNIT